MNDRDLSNYEVVRKDFISDPEEVYLNFSKGKIYVNSYGVKQFPDEDYIRILINQETRSLVIKPYKEKVSNNDYIIPYIRKPIITLWTHSAYV